MFKKPFRVKSNTQLKGSDRKSLKELVLKSFPNLTETDVESLFLKKQVIHNVKIITSSNDIVQVYTIDKYPMIFAVKDRILPTVYLLWKFPNLLHSFTTFPQVFQQYISTGADLMLPGVLMHNKYGNIDVNDAGYVNTVENKAAVAVGVAPQSSSDMLKSGGRGKCLIIYHFYGDKLCDFETSILPIVNMGPPDSTKITNDYDSEFPKLDGSNENIKSDTPQIPTTTTTIIQDENMSEIKNEYVDNNTEITTDEMDELLNYCFLVALKYSKTLVLPILTSNFYKLQLLPVCPQGKSLDIKKTSYKKLKPFLDSMAKDGLITIQETKKGVESIVAINRDHQKLTEFYIEPSKRPKRPDEETPTSTNIMESFIITQNVLPIFTEIGLNKGDTVQMLDIRKCVTDYVRKHNCQEDDNKRFIKPKEALIKICQTQNNITWEELMERICNSMKSCYKVSTGSDEIINKGKISPITITVSTRSCNKKVTLVDNLELFNIRLNDFAKECQHGVAASTTINKVAGKKCDQLLVQGNQVIFIYNLLTEKYKIPIKYIRGLENAPKKKK